MDLAISQGSASITADIETAGVPRSFGVQVYLKHQRAAYLRKTLDMVTALLRPG
jgi:hypothetical protein